MLSELEEEDELGLDDEPEEPEPDEDDDESLDLVSLLPDGLESPDGFESPDFASLLLDSPALVSLLASALSPALGSLMAPDLA